MINSVAESAYLRGTSRSEQDKKPDDADENIAVAVILHRGSCPCRWREREASFDWRAAAWSRVSAASIVAGVHTVSNPA